MSRARRAPEGGCKLFIIFEHVSALDFSDFDCAEDTFARQNANKFAFALAYCYLCTLYYSYEIRTRTYALRQSRPCGCAAHRPRGGAHADIHARGHGGRNEGNIPPRPEKRGAGAHNTRQYLPPLSASRHGDNRACRRRAPFLDVGRPDADRQRRLSGLFAGRMPQTQRGGLPLPLAYRRVASSVHARERHRHRAHHRRRHHDGVRRVSSGRCAARLCGQVAGHDRAVARPLLRPLPTDAAQVRPLSGSVPDRAGVLVSRSQGSAPPATCCNTMPTDTP